MSPQYWYDLAQVMDAIIIIVIGLVLCGYLTAIVGNLVERKISPDEDSYAGDESEAEEDGPCLHCEIDHNVCMDCGCEVELNYEDRLEDR
jgi:hypothetical protein